MFIKQNKMDDKCRNCRNPYVKTGKKYKRIKAEQFLHTKTIKQHFSDINLLINSSKCVCSSCYLSLQKFLALKENPDFGFVTINKTQYQYTTEEDKNPSTGIQQIISQVELCTSV